MLRKMQMAAACLGAYAVIVIGTGPTAQSRNGVTVVQTRAVNNYWDYPDCRFFEAAFYQKFFE